MKATEPNGAYGAFPARRLGLRNRFRLKPVSSYPGIVGRPRGGVDPVHAQFERAMNRRDGVVIVLMSPSEWPAGTPMAQAR